MRVLLISENRVTTLVAPFPIGLACVAGSLRDAGHEVAVLDLMFLGDWQEKLRDTLTKFNPDVIGLSVRNIDNQDARNPDFFLKEHLDIIEICRRAIPSPLVLGGSGFNIHPAGCINYLNADMGIYGEGEEAFPVLLDTMQSGISPEKVPGAVWRKDHRIVVNPPRFIPDLDKWVKPSFDAFDVSAYHDDTQGEIPGCITLQSKRGCHMKCIYCSTPFLEGKRSRARTLMNVVNEMKTLFSEKGIQRFYIADNVFNFPVSHARDFCREIINVGLTVNWQAIINPAFEDEELFALMSRAGCRFISLGNESGSELILTNLRKGFTLKKVQNMANLAREQGIRFGCFLLLGGPGETEDTVKQSIAFVEGLAPDLVTLKAGIRIYPGTPIEDMARKAGMITHDQDLLFPAFYLSPAIKDWVWGYLEEVCHNRPNWKM